MQFHMVLLPIPAPMLALLFCSVLCALLPCTNTAHVTLDDLVVAFPVDEPHLPLAYASRAWRKVRTSV